MEKIDWKKLSAEMPYKWRVQSFSKRKPKASCVAYVDARDVMNRLDEVLGPENWQDEYRMVGDKMMAGISIRIGDEWVTKWDTGSESKVEAEKGEVSDSFKRAAVKWGPGRFLYSLDIQYVDASAVKTDNNWPYVIDSNGKRVWDLTAHINNKKNKISPTKTTTPPVNKSVDTVDSDEKCDSCKGPMWDNRTNKKSPSSPDFVCKQENGECKSDKGFPTAKWVKDMKKAPAPDNKVTPQMKKNMEEFEKDLK